MQRSRDTKANAAFTLLELLVACSITTLLAAVLLSLFLGITDSWRKDTARTDAFREARAALQLISGELDKAEPWVADNAVFEIGGAEGSRTLNYITRIPTAAQPEDEALSEYCGVQLFLASASADSGAALALYRRLIPSKTLFGRLQRGHTDLFDAAPAAGMPYAEVIALNVTSFDVVYRNADLAQAPLPANRSSGFLEIRLGVVGGRSARLYFDPATPTEVRERVLKTEGRSFVQRAGLR